MHDYTDLRSDTVTTPTEKMKLAALHAALGDDVMREDPATRRLEETAAEITGKEAALLVTSGTQGNVIAAALHCSPGSEAIMDDSCHVFLHEQAALARIAFSQPRTLPVKHGMMELDAVRRAVRKNNIHFPRTKALFCENTHNRSGGMWLPIHYLKALRSIADEHGLKIHMDGARLFNASVASGVAVKEITRYADSVMFCLSKGL
ncbi:MAG TPA: low specificity L-threonine aldolase, partial [Planctomycetes bacterium]|nr:low specificity L-threonine aldolase [Planctomycetota bacterium]